MKWVATLIGLALLCGAFLLYRNTTAFLQHARVAPGIVESFEEQESTDNESHKIMYYPVISFSTPDGQPHSFRSDVGTSSRGTTGEKVEVLYDPAKPESARIKGFFHLWGAASICGGLGILFFLAGISAFRRALR